MLALRRRWAGLSILNKAIVLSCTFVIPILLVVGLLLNDFSEIGRAGAEASWR